jgi:hypothetical protein
MRRSAKRTSLTHCRNGQKEAVDVRNAPKRCGGAPEYQGRNKTCRQEVEVVECDEGGVGKVRAYMVIVEFGGGAWHFLFHLVPETWFLAAVCDSDSVS